MLTRKQNELLVYIHEQLQTRGVSPSFDEMKDALGLKSKSGIHRLITALEERGFVRRLPHRARALEVLKLPENMAPPDRSQGGFRPSVIEGGRSVVPSPANVSAMRDDLIEVPMTGKIAAGVPIAAINNPAEMVPVPGAILPSGGDHYALTVEGDSMIGVGINDGDTIIVQKSDTARSGEIIVAYIPEKEEATLKTLRIHKESIALEAANPAYETKIYGPGRVEIQGKLVALMRQY